MSPAGLRERIERLAAEAEPSRDASLPVVEQLLVELESGRVRSAEPCAEGWRAVEWVKRGILLAFRVGTNEASGLASVFSFRDRDTLPTLDPAQSGRDVRIVPGGTTVRRGAYLANGVVVMPPAYVNVGAWIGEGTMVDSHALVGSCAQIGSGVHLSAAAQIGGVLEPIGALPVIVEDGAFIGGGCGLYEGARIGQDAVLAPGVTLTRSTPVYDLPRERVLRASPDAPVEIPAGAVVVCGSRPASGQYARRDGIQLQCPVIVKYRDRGTDAALVLEQALR